ncbi:uncharacterized protein PpBr36_10759 [Pyricularia pennisetigena]|uniref:uncharacterized protein n=1 Tax=Pyricularia pennisetigena TaxID=1578925 RepID=UPI00114DB770|nr:uncharacterized protein PpBr36_10759 [Pyricularia pennisetigena]TLS20890.1 hypothetical protein PpBr36_10759 [Pyricularia pennisetigena]
MSKKRQLLGLGVVSLLFLFTLKTLNTRAIPSKQSWLSELATSKKHDPSAGDGRHGLAPPSSIPIPAEYRAASLLNLSEPLSDFCRDRFGLYFLENFSRCRADYCSKDSVSDLRCFHTPNPGVPGAKDSFCIARHGLSFDVKRRKFSIKCQPRDPEPRDAGTCAVPFRNIASYGYLTGPKYILNEWVDLDATAAPAVTGTGRPNGDSYVVLLKREVEGNIWHAINEIMAMMTTFDVLKIAPESTGGTTGLFSPEAVLRTEIVVLDDLPDGGFFELFQMFTGSKPKRVDEWIASKQKDKTSGSIHSLGNVIIPFAGSANPLWSDWNPIDCSDNTMLRVFVQRVFDFYKIPRRRERAAGSRPLVSFIIRKGSRHLLGLDTHLFAAVKARFGDVADLRMVDFEGMPFREQVRAARDSDVLVGMHGAGLTHAMFMEEGRGALVEIQPDRLCHWGFRNLAKMTGHEYFVAGASRVVGNCYAVPEGLSGAGEVQIVPNDGTGLPYDTSRCYTSTTDASAWSFECSDPNVTGGDRSFWTCKHRDTNDDWYRTCKKKEAADIWWMTRYIMEQDRFVKLVGDAIDAVRGSRPS